MATNEVDEAEFAFDHKAAKTRVEFWASTVDAFLQDFIEKAASNDRLGTLVACARLAQLGAAISDEYKASCGELCDSPTELKVAQQACGLVVDMVNRNGELCEKLREGKDDTVPVTVPAPDRTLS